VNNVSKLKVVHSDAGWYIGRICMDYESFRPDEQHSRESGYYATKKEAESILAIKLQLAGEVKMRRILDLEGTIFLRGMGVGIGIGICMTLMVLLIFFL